MPYIDREERRELDEDIERLVSCIINTVAGTADRSSPNDFKNYLGRINYCFSRILCGVMGNVSYPKIAMATGVLENVKQEFYRRLAARYEDNKIELNGDIVEYWK